MNSWNHPLFTVTLLSGIRNGDRGRDEVLLRIVDPEILGIGLVAEHRFPEPEASHPGLVGVDGEEQRDGDDEDDGQSDADQRRHQNGVDNLENV